MKKQKKKTHIVITAFVVLVVVLFSSFRFYQFYYSPLAAIVPKLSLTDSGKGCFIRMPQYLYETISPFGMPSWLKENIENFERLPLAQYQEKYANPGTYLDYQVHQREDATVLQIKGTGVLSTGEIVSINDLYLIELRAPLQEGLR